MATRKVSRKQGPAKPAKQVTQVKPAGGEVSKSAAREKHIFEILDAEKVFEATLAHRERVRKKGVTDEKLAAYAAQIALGKSVENLGGRVTLDSTREAVKDLLGDYRDAGNLVATPLAGRDHELAKTLLVDGPFPSDDAALDRYLTAVAAPIAAHRDALAGCDFSAEQQAELAEAAASFHRAFEARPTGNTALKNEGAHRARVLKVLRSNTASIRLAGRIALKKSSLRSDFDRPKPTDQSGKLNLAAAQAAKKAESMKAAAAKQSEAARVKEERAARAAAKSKLGKKGLPKDPPAGK